MVVASGAEGEPMNHEDCPEGAELAEFSRGNLSAPVLARVAQHVAACRSCEEALEALDAVSDPLMTQLRRPHPAGETVDFVPVPLLAVARAARGAPALQPPQPRRLGKFELCEELGSGAFGRVFRARDTELDRTVAIKI